MSAKDAQVQPQVCKTASSAAPSRFSRQTSGYALLQLTGCPSCAVLLFGLPYFDISIKVIQTEQ